MQTTHYDEFKKRLEEKREEVRRELNGLRTEIEAICAEDEIDDEVDLAQLESDSVNHRIQIERLEKELGEIHRALEKIARGNYGVCEMTGKPIPIERLRAEPTARTVVAK